MLSIIGCSTCGKSSYISFENFDDKSLFISLEIKRSYDYCKCCNNIKDLSYREYFCSAKCLKEWVVDNLDTYIAYEVMGGKYNKQN